VLVGLASAAVAARVSGAPRGPELWAGAVIASGLPDLDLVLEWLGFKGPRYHRNGSHSLVLVGVLAAAVWIAVRQLAIPLDDRVVLAWAVALASHPVLDVVTTGPTLGKRGYGIGILWPLHGKRWYSRRPVIDQITDWGACRSMREVWNGLWPEVALLGPVCVLVFGLSFVV
jgi:membrane-bound metal-dependent hydrolase YbcI (DUF457 family)